MPTHKINLLPTVTASLLTNYVARYRVPAAWFSDVTQVWFSSDEAGNNPIASRLVWTPTGGNAAPFDIEVASVSAVTGAEFYFQYGDKPFDTDPYRAAAKIVTDTSDDFSDLTTNGNDGTGLFFTAGAVTGPDGDTPAAETTSGSASRVVVSDDASLDITGAITIKGWVKVQATPGSGQAHGFASKYKPSGNNRGYAVTVQEGREVRALISSDGTSPNTKVVLGSALPLDEWKHVVVVFEPSTAIRIYIDGSLDTEDTTSIPASINTNAEPLYWGTYVSPSTSTSLDGEFSDLSVHAEAQSDAEANADYLLQGPNASTYWTTSVVGGSLLKRAKYGAGLRLGWKL